MEEILTRSEAETKSRAGNPSRTDVHLMFDRIAWRYDLLNRLLSFGQDILWRKEAVSFLSGRQQETILDLACGTCDLALAACKRDGQQNLMIGLDRAAQMLQLAQAKIVRQGVQRSIELVQGDGENLPFYNQSFDAAMIAFGIRNMVDTGRTLREMCRVLKPGGKAIILEFSQPSSRILRWIYLLHLRLIVPALGRLISGDRHTYRYLDRTIETYHQGEEFLELMSNQGLGKLQRRPLTFGVATIYVGEKE